MTKNDFDFITGVLFSDSILAWQTNPMVINLGDTGLPVRNLDFPAVTVCDDQVTDRWYFIEALLNVLDLNCRKGTSTLINRLFLTRSILFHTFRFEAGCL